MRGFVLKEACTGAVKDAAKDPGLYMRRGDTWLLNDHMYAITHSHYVFSM